MGAVLAQRGAKLRLILDRRLVMKPGEFQPKSLSTTTGTKFDCAKIHVSLFAHTVPSHKPRVCAVAELRGEFAFGGW